MSPACLLVRGLSQLVAVLDIFLERGDELGVAAGLSQSESPLFMAECCAKLPSLLVAVGQKVMQRRRDIHPGIELHGYGVGSDSGIHLALIRQGLHRE